MKKLFLQSSELMIGEFPEYPNTTGQSTMGESRLLAEYGKAIEAAKDRATNVVDPPTWIKNLVFQDVLMPLPKGWTVEITWQQKSSTKQDAAWLDCTYDTAVLKPGFESRKIARLVPVIPPLTEAQRRALIDEGAPQKGIIITDNPEEVGQIYYFNQDVTGDKEYGTELSLVDMSDKQLNTLLDKVDGGIVATGIPEAGRHYEYGDVCGKCGSPCSVGPRGLYCSKCEPHRSGEAVPESGEKPEHDFIKYLKRNELDYYNQREEWNEDTPQWRMYNAIAAEYILIRNHFEKHFSVPPPSQASKQVIDDTDLIEQDLHTFGIACEMREGKSVIRLDPRNIVVRRRSSQAEMESQEEIVRQIAGIAWKAAANAYRMYPNNSHTFAAYWDAAKDQFKEFFTLTRKTKP